MGIGRRGSHAGPHVPRQRRVGVVRRRPGGLPVRVDLRRVRGRLPLRGVAAAAADGDAEPAGLGRLPAAQERQPCRPPGARRHPTHRPRFHPPSLPHPLGGPPARVLGMHPRRAGHLPADAGVAALRERRPAGRPLPGVLLAGRHAALRRRQHPRLAHLPRPRHRRGARARGRVHLPAPPTARPGSPGDRAGQRLPRPRRPVRGVGHRVVPHRVEHLAGGPLLLGAQHRCTRSPSSSG